jgi:anion-transporting  ArsA/GET3 family ATPase
LDPLSFFSQTRAFIVTGKGGAGKTTVSGVMANLAARQGLRALIVQLGTPGARREPEPAYLFHLFGRKEVLGYEEISLRPPGLEGGEVTARALRPDSALSEYLYRHGMRRISQRLVSSGALDIVATAVPGMPDMLVLGKLKQLERAAAAGQPGAPDVILLDAPAAGHAVRFLQSPYGLLDAAGGGPVRAQAEEVVEMLGDPARCQVVLVTTPEETPVSETIETAALLEDRAGAKLCGVVVNGRFPVLSLPPPVGAGELADMAADAGVDLSKEQSESLVAAADLRRQRQEDQAVQVARLAAELPLPQLELPFCFSAELGPDQLADLTDALELSVGSWVPVST